MKYITPADGLAQIKAGRLLEGFKEQPSSHYIHSFHVKCWWNRLSHPCLSIIHWIHDNYINVVCELHFRYSKTVLVVTSGNTKTNHLLQQHSGLDTDSIILPHPIIFLFTLLTYDLKLPRENCGNQKVICNCKRGVLRNLNTLFAQIMSVMSGISNKYKSIQMQVQISMYTALSTKHLYCQIEKDQWTLHISKQQSNTSFYH